MRIILYCFAALWALFGILMIFLPQIIISGYKKFFSVFSIKPCGVFAIIVGMLFLICARVAKGYWVIAVFGILAQIKGIFFLLMPEKSISMVNWWTELDPVMWRIMGALPIIFGALVVFFTGF